MQQPLQSLLIIIYKSWTSKLILWGMHLDFMGTFHLSKSGFGIFPVPILAPSPVIESELTISIGFNSQWNLGRKRQRWPFSLIKVSSIDSWLIKSSCWERSQAIQQFWLLIGHTGEHLALNRETSNPQSSSTAFGFTGGSGHWLTEMRIIMWLGNDGVTLHALLSTIGFIHLKCSKSMAVKLGNQGGQPQRSQMLPPLIFQRSG